MHKRIGLLGTVTAVLLVGGLVAMQAIATAHGGGRGRSIKLSGANELDPATLEPGAGDPDGRGRASIKIDEDDGEVCFTISWKNIGAPMMAHIHDGDKTENGPIVVTLFDNAGAPLPATIDEVSGCVEGVDEALAEDIEDNPRDFYVNVHNEDFPAGAIRGQLKGGKGKGGGDDD